MEAANHDFRIILPTYAISGIKAFPPLVNYLNFVKRSYKFYSENTEKRMAA